MTIGHPTLLAVSLIVTAALAWAALAAGRRRARALAAAGVSAQSSRKARGGRRGWPGGVWLTVAGLAVLAVAVAGPSVTRPVSHAHGTVILAIDTSGSMSATDVAPSRLAAAKQAATAFVNAQPSSVEIGVVAFQEDGLEAAAPTTDHAAATTAIDRLKPGGGTSLGGAIMAGLAAITHQSVTLPPNFNTLPNIGFWPSATIVLFSDGQDEGVGSSSGGSPRGSNSGSISNGAIPTDTAAAIAQQAGVHVDTIGVGTAAGTTVDVEGYHLFTGLDAANLQLIAHSTDGSYHPASNASELNGIASSINLRLTVTNQPYPLAGAFTALALALLAAGAMLSLVRTGRVI